MTQKNRLIQASAVLLSAAAIVYGLYRPAHVPNLLAAGIWGIVPAPEMSPPVTPQTAFVAYSVLLPPLPAGWRPQSPSELRIPYRQHLGARMVPGWIHTRGTSELVTAAPVTLFSPEEAAVFLDCLQARVGFSGRLTCELLKRRLLSTLQSRDSLVRVHETLGDVVDQRLVWTAHDSAPLMEWTHFNASALTTTWVHLRTQGSEQSWQLRTPCTEMQSGACDQLRAEWRVYLQHLRPLENYDPALALLKDRISRTAPSAHADLPTRAASALELLSLWAIQPQDTAALRHLADLLIRTWKEVAATSPERAPLEKTLQVLAAYADAVPAASGLAPEIRRALQPLPPH